MTRSKTSESSKRHRGPITIASPIPPSEEEVDDVDERAAVGKIVLGVR